MIVVQTIFKNKDPCLSLLQRFLSIKTKTTQMIFIFVGSHQTLHVVFTYTLLDLNRRRTSLYTYLHFKNYMLYSQRQRHPKSLRFSTLSLLRIPIPKFADIKTNCMLTISLSKYNIFILWKKTQEVEGDTWGSKRRERIQIGVGH
jgi:hypothetical protein